VDEDEYLISVAMNRRHLTEGQKAVLANEYMKILSKKAKTQRAEIANAVKYGKVSLSETVTDKESERHEVDTRKEASGKFKVSEWKVRITQEIEKTAPKVYERLGSGDLQIHEAKIIAQLPWDNENMNPQPIQKIYPIIEFSEVSHSKGENILPYLLSLKFTPSFWFFLREFQ